VVASFEPRVEQFRLAADGDTLVLSVDNKLKAFRLDGSLKWEVVLETNLSFVHAGYFDLSADGRRLIVKLPNIVAVAHIIDGQVLANRYTTDSTIWNVQMAPAGEWSVSTEVMPGRVTRFRNGAIYRQVILPVDYLYDVDINDYGEILVAGRDENYGPLHALMLDASGEVVLQCVGAYTAGPYLNEVFFDAAGTQVVLSWNDGLHTFRILR
jgi:hypothetical protein